MTVQDVFQAGSEFFTAAAAAGSAFYFVKGAMRGSSKGSRLDAGVQEVTNNGGRICSWAAWLGVFMSIESGVVRVRRVHDPWNNAAAWGGANALFSVHRGPRAAVQEGIKGAAYSAVAGLAYGFLAVFLELRKKSD
uniref:Uncharacterized protein n=1 Tax=Avena sativa TaxID=4498 RepID=A0ACD5W5H1_AVESA